MITLEEGTIKNYVIGRGGIRQVLNSSNVDLNAHRHNVLFGSEARSSQCGKLSQVKRGWLDDAA